MENTVNAKIIDKITKLINLANNSGATVGEAASAFEQAQLLLSKHRLSMAEIENTNKALKEDIVEGDQALYTGERVVHWKSWLADRITFYNGCKCIIKYGKLNGQKQVRFIMIGRQNDIEICQYLFNSIVSQIETLCAFYMKTGNGSGKTWSNNFKMGAVETIDKRLKAAVEQVKSENIGSTAMVLVNEKDKELEDWVSKKYSLKRGSSSPFRNNNDAREMGKMAGNNISLNKGLSGNNSIKELK